MNSGEQTAKVSDQPAFQTIVSRLHEEGCEYGNLIDRLHSLADKLYPIPNTPKSNGEKEPEVFGVVPSINQHISYYRTGNARLRELVNHLETIV